MAEAPSVAEIEKALLQIPGVRAARLVLDGRGKPTEVHIVAGPEKSPKQLVRDVQTVSLAHFGVDFDHRIVSVVQFPEGEMPVPPPVRPSIQEISTNVQGASALVKVALTREQQISSGEAHGPNTRDGLVRLAAVAALQAVTGFLPEKSWAELEYVGIQRIGEHEVAVATLSVGKAGAGRRSVSGSAVVGAMSTEAVVRAVLDALNRLL